MIRVLVLGRNRATCEGIAAGLAASEDIESAGTARSAEEVLEIVKRSDEAIDVVVAGSTLPEGDVLRLAKRFRRDSSSPRLVVTGLAEGDGTILRYLEAGAHAFLTEELSLSGLLLVLRLLERDEVLMAPDTVYRLVRRVHAMADLLESSGLDVSLISTLTSREKEVLDLLGQSLTNREIARKLHIAVGTVKSHVHAVLNKLNIRDREEARRVLILSRAMKADEREFMSA